MHWDHLLLQLVSYYRMMELNLQKLIIKTHWRQCKSWDLNAHFQPPRYVNVSSAKITLPLVVQLIYELSLANDFQKGPCTVSCPHHAVKRKIHRINVLENIVAIKSIAPQKRSSYSLKSAQLTCAGRTWRFNSPRPAARQRASVQRGCASD